MLLDGKVAIVSGIGPGMGRDITLALAREGADIAIGARREKGLVKVAGEVEALGRKAVWVQTDITVADDCERLARRPPATSWAGSTSWSTTPSATAPSPSSRRAASTAGARPWTSTCSAPCR